MWRVASALLVLGLAGLVPVAPPQTPSPTGPPGPRAVGQEPLAIVINQANLVNGLSMADLRRVFLGERGHWPNGGRRITLVMLDPGWPERDEVLNSIYHMDETEFKNHFLRGLFTGEVLVSPKTLSTPEGVRKFIFNVPGAIGYLRASDVDKTVKVIRIDERLPGDKGYKLHVPLRESK